MLLVSDYAFMFVLALLSGSRIEAAPSPPRTILDAILGKAGNNALETSRTAPEQGAGGGDLNEQRLKRDTESEATDVTFSEALDFLSDFHYLPEVSTSETAASSISLDAVANALRSMQRMAGIETTGELDDETKRMMRSPRCGVPDRVGPEADTSRRRRYVIRDTKWGDNELSYKIKNYTPDLDSATVDQILQRAFQMWQDVSPLTFTKKTSGDVNIELEFVTGDHGDGHPFDGPRTASPRPGVKLAHAFFPLTGDVHFDDDEVLTNDQNDVNLLQLAVHELGHSLGLEHSNDKMAVMTPYYYYRPTFNLHPDDIAGIQDLYGPPPPPPPTTTTPPVVTTPSTPTCRPRNRPRPVRPRNCPRRQVPTVRRTSCGLPRTRLVNTPNCPSRLRGGQRRR